VQFQTKTQQPSTASESTNAPPVGMTFIASFSLKIIIYIGIYPLVFAEETLVNQPVEISSPQHASSSSSPSVQPSPSQAETSTSPGIQLSPPQAEVPVSLGMNPSSPQPEASNLPGTAPASPQPEASALPGNPQTPLQLITQEIPLEPEQTSFQVQETIIEVSVNTCTFISTQ
jgi:hypothetical protein